VLRGHCIQPPINIINFIVARELSSYVKDRHTSSRRCTRQAKAAWQRTTRCKTLTDSRLRRSFTYPVLFQTFGARNMTAATQTKCNQPLTFGHYPKVRKQDIQNGGSDNQSTLYAEEMTLNLLHTMPKPVLVLDKISN
jgi:hypothetical protein